MGLIGPFIAIASNPSSIGDIPILNSVYATLGFRSYEDFVVALGLFTIAAFCVKSVAYVVTNAYVFKVTFGQKKALVSRMMSAYLSAPYVFFLKKNTSSIVQKISIETTTFSQDYMMSLLMAVVNFITIILLLGLLAKTNPVFLMGILGVILLILIAFQLLSSRFKRWGRMRTEADQNMIRSVNHSLGGLKETRVIGCESYFEEQILAYGNQWARAVTLFRSSKMVFPVIVQTSLIVTVIGYICGSLVFADQGLESITSVMAVFVAASLRLVPSVNQFVNSIGSLVNSSHILDIIYLDLKEIESLNSIKNSQYKDDLSQALEENPSFKSNSDANLNFRKSVELQNVSYKYPSSSEPAVKDISLSIKKGESVALIGKSGAGKTTLVDIILGLLKPQDGDIRVDGVSVYSDLRSWQGLVGYIPQSIFLMDDTIERNIAFGVPDHLIEHEKLHKAIESAQLNDLIESLPDGISSQMGERGIRLSGGQRQRIGIARALYHEREILVLDEATAALDNETERLVTESINALAGKKTLIIIAHRLSTIKQCDRVFELGNGKLINSGTYSEVVKNTV